LAVRDVIAKEFILTKQNHYIFSLLLFLILEVG
jgi:hypothetical protein